MEHTYEEVRTAAFKALASMQSPSQYNHLKIEVGKIIDAYDGLAAKPPMYAAADRALTKPDADLLREVFWDLFRQGILTLGQSDMHAEFPFYTVTTFGKKVVTGNDVYFVTDTTDFEKRIREEIPQIDPVSLLYLKESFQALRSGCLISSAVTLGVAAENMFELLIDQINRNPNLAGKFKNVLTPNLRLLTKIDKFKAIIASDKSNFPKELREGFDTQFLGIQDLIRFYRNESGHPTGKVIDREQAFVNLRLFFRFGRMLHTLMSHYR